MISCHAAKVAAVVEQIRRLGQQVENYKVGAVIHSFCMNQVEENISMTDTKAPSNASTITVNGRVANPHEHYAKDARQTDHIILTLKDNVTHDQHATLEELKVQFQEDLGNFTYLCRYVPPSLTPLRELKWIRQVDVYRNKFKIPEELQSCIQNLTDSGNGNDAIPINVMPHPEYDNATNLQELAFNVATAAGIDLSDIEILFGKVQLRATAGQIEKIASLDQVRVIEEVLVPCLDGDQAINVVFGSVQHPGVQKFRGENQVVAVIDTGFDLGMPSK